MCKKLHAVDRIENIIQLLRRKTERSVRILEFGEATKPTYEDTESFQGGKEVFMRQPSDVLIPRSSSLFPTFMSLSIRQHKNRSVKPFWML